MIKFIIGFVMFIWPVGYALSKRDFVEMQIPTWAEELMLASAILGLALMGMSVLG